MAEVKTHKAFVENGHIFEVDKFGDLEMEVYSPEYHGYIYCVVCNESWCDACDRDRKKTEDCENRAGQPTLPGLEYIQEKT